MRIAITSANCHVGANLARLLLEEGHDLRLLIHEREDAVAGLTAERVRGDVTDPEAMRGLVRGSDAVIHAAARISIDGDRDGELARVNVAGTRAVVEACLAEGVGRLVHFSSIHTYDLSRSTSHSTRLGRRSPATSRPMTSPSCWPTRRCGTRWHAAWTLCWWRRPA